MKKVSLLLSVLLLCGCARGGGMVTIDAKKLPSSFNNEVNSFNYGKYLFQTYAVCKNENNEFVMGKYDSWIKTVNGTPDHLLRFKGVQTVVYALDENGNNYLPNVVVQPSSIYNDEVYYVVAEYKNIKIWFSNPPGESNPEPYNIGVLIFYC